MTEIETVTAEQAAQNYSAALDSVNLIAQLTALESLDEEQTGTVSRNVEHLELMVAKTYWTTEDLTPLTDAISAGKS